MDIRVVGLLPPLKIRKEWETEKISEQHTSYKTYENERWKDSKTIRKQRCPLQVELVRVKKTHFLSDSGQQFVF